MQNFDENFLLIPLQEIQQENDMLQECIRAEELNKQSTTDLKLRVHALQNELSTLRETLTARDKQIASLNQLLEHSKKINDPSGARAGIQWRQRHNDKSLVDRLEAGLKRKSDENQRLKDKIKTEMVNKVALPNLMETTMAEKNEEIDSLREMLMDRESQQKSVEQTFVRYASDNSTPPVSCIGGTVLSMILESGVQFAPPPQYHITTGQFI